MKLILLLLVTTIASAQIKNFPLPGRTPEFDTVKFTMEVTWPDEPTRDTTRVILQISDTSTRRLKYCCRPDGSTFDTTMAVNSFVQWLSGYEIRDRNRHYIYQHVRWLDDRKQVLPDKYLVWVSWRIIP